MTIPRNARSIFLIAMGVVLSTNSLSLAIEDEQHWKMQTTGVDASLRGLCVVGPKIAWASGTGGTVVRTSDGGETWANVSVAGAAELDFRDIHAFDDQTAVITSAGQPARIYRTSNAGKTWLLQFEHSHPKAFFDAMSFGDDQHGIVMSDPVDGRLLLVETSDGGINWNELPPERSPKTLKGEYGFAASGTNMCVVGGESVFVALGGAEQDQTENTCRILYSLDRGEHWADTVAPIARNPSSGIFSVAFADSKNGVAIGGDYKNEESNVSNIAITVDGGKTWTKPTGTAPRGFRSCVTSRKAKKGLYYWLAVGPTGTDYSLDGGTNWKAASNVGFHAAQFSPDGSACYASGTDGRIGIWGPTNKTK